MHIELADLGYCASKAQFSMKYPQLTSDFDLIFSWVDILAFNIVMGCLLRSAGRQGYEMALYTNGLM